MKTRPNPEAEAVADRKQDKKKEMFLTGVAFAADYSHLTPEQLWLFFDNQGLEAIH